MLMGNLGSGILQHSHQMWNYKSTLEISSLGVSVCHRACVCVCVCVCVHTCAFLLGSKTTRKTIDPRKQGLWENKPLVCCNKRVLVHQLLMILSDNAREARVAKATYYRASEWIKMAEVFVYIPTPLCGRNNRCQSHWLPNQRPEKNLPEEHTHRVTISGFHDNRPHSKLLSNCGSMVQVHGNTWYYW